MALLSLGHLFTDLFSSAAPTLQPLLVDKYSLSLAQAGVLGGVYMFSSSVLQLPFGVLSDRLHTRLFSVFEVVKNPADKWPEYALYIITVGLVVHFGLMLILFIYNQIKKSAHGS